MYIPLNVVPSMLVTSKKVRLKRMPGESIAVGPGHKRVTRGGICACTIYTFGAIHSTHLEGF